MKTKLGQNNQTLTHFSARLPETFSIYSSWSLTWYRVLFNTVLTWQEIKFWSLYRDIKIMDHFLKKCEAWFFCFVFKLCHMWLTIRIQCVIIDTWFQLWYRLWTYSWNKIVYHHDGHSFREPVYTSFWDHLYVFILLTLNDTCRSHCHLPPQFWVRNVLVQIAVSHYEETLRPQNAVHLMLF